MSNNPYKNCSDYAFWRRAVSDVEKHNVDPVVTTKFKIDKREKVATAGSCFAQHISRMLHKAGFNYFVPEDGSYLSPDIRKELNYGVFSARYGNIYTSRQLLQLLEECYDNRQTTDQAWKRSDGVWVDPLRPRISPAGFASPDEVKQSRTEHLMHVRRVFEECDIFIFTLGLTEAWRSKLDGTVFPIAPGVAGGNFSNDRYEFVNLDVNDVLSDMETFLEKFKVINTNAKILLTVSPVPLIATYERSHVLCATTYSKSVLRVAAEMLAKSRTWVDYFPSYEIIIGNYNRSSYYESDYRQVSAIGVSHAMRCFNKNYLNQTQLEFNDSESTFDPSDIICDEEAIEKLSF